MGCDIHMHTEVKIDGKWEHYSAPDVPRDYELFALMADVRNGGDVQALSKPRGLPHDLSVVTRLASDDDGLDGHSHSYLDAKEIAVVGEWIRNKRSPRPEEFYFGILFDSDYSDFSREPKPEGVQDVRFVFWFDN